jgi:hypothetical protein
MPKMIRISIIAFLILHFGVWSAKAQSVSSETIKKIVANRPDYRADYSVVIGRELIKIKLARRGKSFRHEIMPAQNAVAQINDEYRYYELVTLTIPSKPVVAIDPQEKTYTELRAGFEFPTPDIEHHFQAALQQEGKIIGEELGIETVDHHSAKKIRIRFASGEMVTIYVASDLNDLVVKLEGTYEGVPISLSMSNISLQVPQDLFEVPKDYHRVDFEAFMATTRRKMLK